MVWPLPALLTWLAAWALLLPAQRRSAARHRLRAGDAGHRLAGLAPEPPLAPPDRAGRLSLSFLALVQGGLPAWAWLAPLALLLLLYPLRSWRDAPLFPTRPRPWTAWPPPRCPPAPGCWKPAAAWATACALHRLPDARLTGLEWSAPLATLCRLRCRFAQVRRGDIWTEDWSGYQMVYLFQRPESMPRAVAKARRS
jgi:hypothetical protein